MNADTLRDKTCFFAGHRDIPFDAYPAVQAKLKTEVEALIEKGVHYFGVGGALGFDTIAALTILQLKKAHPQIRLILILPCKGHDFSWQGKDKAVFDTIRKRADKIIYTSDRYHDGCMYKRNRHMADSAGWGIVYLSRPTGGTAYTVSYAYSVGVRIVNLVDED